LAGSPRPKRSELSRFPSVPFVYVDKGAMATIGRSRAVLEFGKIRATGFSAWLAWLFVHIYYLLGVENKTFVFFRWMRSSGERSHDEARREKPPRLGVTETECGRPHAPSSRNAPARSVRLPWSPRVTKFVCLGNFSAILSDIAPRSALARAKRRVR